ncbi:hypothetical protein BX070DRAFT_191716 [Coemansia spiralis]|nr:hypothetical protein BX070DRAFT_191716 [Coemansia spiralis]
MLCRKEFTIYLLGEYKASLLCPGCLDGELEPFKWIENCLCVKCHGLLYCKNDKCLENAVKTVPGTPLSTYYWDRDVAAALNCRHIFKGPLLRGKQGFRALQPKNPVEAAY